MKRTARGFWCLIALCLTVFGAEAKPGAAKPVRVIDFSELDKLVPAELKEKNTPGTVIAIISGDQVVYQKAFGVANVETNAEMQPEMLFRLGSTTKMFTAAALLALSGQNSSESICCRCLSCWLLVCA